MEQLDLSLALSLKSEVRQWLATQDPISSGLKASLMGLSGGQLDQLLGDPEFQNCSFLEWHLLVSTLPVRSLCDVIAREKLPSILQDYATHNRVPLSLIFSQFQVLLVCRNDLPQEVKEFIQIITWSSSLRKSEELRMNAATHLRKIRPFGERFEKFFLESCFQD
eukprot:TRINITY_DN7074_c0_g2_i3.p1 TRINITY_DN7074_c0_g2~~TRINITY_DN7074_c0_g2_i3.p1  ORF type:complete len:165 (+),score=2.55 TRINITY_DN7074_c0_g2_i3:337-831(+)